MKKPFIAFAAVTVLLGSILLTSCNKDDDKETAGNSITYNGTSYDLTKGFFVTPISKGIGNPISLGLFSSGAVFHTTVDTLDSLSGTGNGAMFVISSVDQNSPSAGTYTMDTTFSMETFTYFFSAVLLNFDFAVGTGTELEIASGNLVIAKSGNTYNISFDGKDDMNKALKINYSGALSHYYE